MPRTEDEDDMRAVARLPGLDIEITHRAPADGMGERMSVTLQATPLLGGRIDAAGPIALWMLMVQAAWTPWLQLAASLWPPALPAARPGSAAAALRRGAMGAYQPQGAGAPLKGPISSPGIEPA